jgi:hypothetical protein
VGRSPLNQNDSAHESRGDENSGDHDDDVHDDDDDDDDDGLDDVNEQALLPVERVERRLRAVA